MIEKLLPLNIPPGVFANGTKYQAKGRWNDANLIRFHEGTIQPIGGWAQRTLTGVTMAGTPVAAVCWQLAAGTPFLAVGTTAGLYVIDDQDVVHDVTPLSTTIHAPPFDWQLSTFGAYLVAVNSLRGDDDIALVNTYVWTGDTTAKATPAWADTEGPIGAYSAFATPERFLVVLRGKDPSTFPARSGVDGVYSERRVYWPSQETLTDFLSSDTNTGGNFDLQTEGRLVVGAPARGQSLLWTDVDLWSMNYIGGDLIYSFQNIGKACGIVGKRAFVMLDKGAFWMGRGKFFVYDGFARTIPCEVTDAVFGDFNESRANIVWAVSNARYNEVTWFYPSRGAQFANRYVTYNHAENHWTFGRLTRSAGVELRFTRDVIDETKPAFLGSAGELFEHESGEERDAQPFVTSGPVEIGDGDRLMRLQGIVPDDVTAGDVALRLYTSMAPDSLERLHGPYSLAAITPLRLTTRQVRVRLEEASAKSWRVGTVRLAVKEAERRGANISPADTVPASIEIVPTAVTMINAQHFTFEAIIRNAAGDVLDMEPDAWHSDNGSQVPIDPSGTITALATPATANITATLVSPALTSNTAVVTVAADMTPATITISPTAFDILPTNTRQMTWVVRNAAGQILVGVNPDAWHTSDATKSTVSSTGVVTGVASTGSTNITASITTSGVTLTSNTAVALCGEPFVTHTFDVIGTNNFVVTSGSGNVRALIIAGGGGGGAADGTGVECGGGGAGGMLDVASIAVAVGTYPVFVGDGGDGGFGDHSIGLADQPGHIGQDTTFAGYTAVGGGGGMTNLDDTDPGTTPYGGSGGGMRTKQEDGGTSVGPGGTTHYPTVTYSPATATAGQGYKGGDGIADGTSMDAIYNYGGGGGGAGGIGENYLAGNGGPGASSDITGVGTYYAGGGGGGRGVDGGVGGIGGGGHGGRPSTYTGAGGGQGTPGTPGTGGGGGGGGGVLFAYGSKGGHGILIVRYKVSSGIVATGGTKVTHS